MILKMVHRLQSNIILITLLLSACNTVQAIVRLGVYYEPQDEASTVFFRHQLRPLYDTALDQELELTLVPYGRADCRNRTEDIT